jgi:hypothetical protein
MGVGSNWRRAPLDPNRRQCFALEPTAEVAAKLAVVAHYLSHQLLDHLLTDDAGLLARQLCGRLRDRVDDFICFRGIDFA